MSSETSEVSRAREWKYRSVGRVMRKDAVAALRPGVNVTSSYSEANGETIQYPDADGTFVPPTEQEIQAKLVQLRTEQAMFLLRYERDQRLAEADRIIMKYTTSVGTADTRAVEIVWYSSANSGS